MSLVLGTGEHFTLCSQDVMSLVLGTGEHFTLRAGRVVLSSGYWRTLYFARRTCCP